jgi:uncharacterized membrane protein
MVENKFPKWFYWISGVVLVIVLFCFGLELILPSPEHIEETVRLGNLKPCKLSDGVWVEVEDFNIADEVNICGYLVTTKSPLEISLSVKETSTGKIIYTHTGMYIRGDVIFDIFIPPSPGQYNVRIIRGRSTLGNLYFKLVR